MLRLEKHAWSMVKLLRQATNEYTPPTLFIVGIWCYLRSMFDAFESITDTLPFVFPFRRYFRRLRSLLG